MDTKSEHKSSLARQADAAFRRAAVKVVQKAKETGAPVVIWENGRVVEASAEEMEKRLGEAEDRGRMTDDR